MTISGALHELGPSRAEARLAISALDERGLANAAGLRNLATSIGGEVGAAAGASVVARTRLVGCVGARITDVVVRSVAVGHETLSSWTLALVGGVILVERRPAPSEGG